MKTSLLTADLHLTDNPLEEYRWSVFKSLADAAIANFVEEIFILGDITDRKDRHNATLLNKMLDHLYMLNDSTGCPIWILMGNHDAPLNGSPYWKFLKSDWIRYVVEPELHDDIWLLPFSPNPKRDWAHLDLAKSRLWFIHQTLEGSRIEGDRVIPKDVQPMPKIPSSVTVFAGDVHRPQAVRSGVYYVGAPHPVRFGEDWDNRFTLLREKAPLILISECPTYSIRRQILEIKNSEELSTWSYIPKKGDQVRIRYSLTSATLSMWPIEEEKIRKWAADSGVKIVSLEATLVADTPTITERKSEELILKPKDILTHYQEKERISDYFKELGNSILSEVEC